MSKRLLIFFTIIVLLSVSVAIISDSSSAEDNVVQISEGTRESYDRTPGAEYTYSDSNGTHTMVLSEFDFVVNDIAYAITGPDTASVVEWLWTFTNHSCSVDHSNHVAVRLYQQYHGSQGSIDVPAVVSYNNQDYRVTSIGHSAFASLSNINISIGSNVETLDYESFYNQIPKAGYELVIPGSVITIGHSAFERFGNTGVELTFSDNSNLKTIEYDAFMYINVSSIVLPHGVEVIGTRAFENTTVNDGKISALDSVTIPGTVKEFNRSILSGYDGTVSFGEPGTTYAEPANYVMSNGVLTGWGNVIFVQDCTGDVVIPEGVTKIGDKAFLNQTGLTSISLPSTLKTIGYGAFSGCTSLSSITIPDDVELTESDHSNTYNGIFSYCSNLTKVEIGDGVDSIPEYCFYGCTGLTEVVLPSTVTTIQNSAFCNCAELANIDLSNVETIGMWAFYGCAKLTNVNLESLKEFEGSAAFVSCGLTSVVLPDGLETLPSATFGRNSSLSTVYIPDSVTNIGSNAFMSCSDGIVVVIGGDCPAYVDGKAFANTTDVSLIVPFGSIESYKTNTTLSPYLFDNGSPKDDVIYRLGEVPDSVELLPDVTLTVAESSVVPSGFELLTYSSSEGVATAVVDGSGVKITAVSAGTSTVTISIVHSETGLEIVSETVTVTVESPIETLTVTISGNTDAYAGQSVTLTANVSGIPEGTTPTYEWYDGTDPITDGTDQTLIINENGSYSVRVTVTTSAGQTASATSETFTVKFHQWKLESDTMELFPDFSPFYLLDYISEDLTVELAEGSAQNVISINDDLITYVGPGTATVTLSMTGFESQNLVITVRSAGSGITVSGDDVKPVVEIPSTEVEQSTREEISNQVSQDETLSSAIPQSAISNGTIVDIKVPGEDGMPVQTRTTLTVPYSWFGAGISYSNHEGFSFYIVHYHDGNADLIENLTFSAEGVSFTVDGFSPFMFASLAIVEPEPEPEYPPYNPGWSDDDYVPLPPVIVQEPSDDDTTAAVACAAAAVVAALMAVFLIMEYRKK